jgi:hypothetical protein
VIQSRELAPRFGLQPFAALNVVARWGAASLARLLLLPDDDELALLGGFRHDVNMGTQMLAPLVDDAFARNQVIARGLPAACTALPPPMWLAGSFASLSPSHAFLYLLSGANRLPPNVFGEAACGTLQVGLFTARGEASAATVTIYHTGLGDLRLRIPVSRRMTIATIALPLARFAREGVLQGVVVQTGETVGHAMESREARAVPWERLVYAGLEQNGRHFRAQEDDGCLLIPVDPPDDETAVYTVALTSLSHDRIVAAAGGIAD